jgi:hypothetical protein
MLDYLIQTAIKLVFLYQGYIFTQQICHGTAPEPSPVQSPFGARRDETIGNQGLQNIEPDGIFVAWRQFISPELIQM